jgi:hypothetical protein
VEAGKGLVIGMKNGLGSKYTLVHGGGARMKKKTQKRKEDEMEGK